jgi:hypothetical protein
MAGVAWPPPAMPSGSAWDDETAHLRRTFDAVADLYRERFTDELETKPYDRGAGRRPRG